MSRTRLRHAWVPSPNVEARRDRRAPHILLLHYTGMQSAQSAVAWLCDPRSKVSCHYLVDEAGAIVQMVDEGMRAWHAGQSQWQGERDINSCSIGIEIHNPGHPMGYPDFPDAQIEAVIALSRDILGRHPIRPESVLAHSDVAPARKADPGEKFDWRRLNAEGIGHWVEPVPVEDHPPARHGDEAIGVQSLLADYGYGIDITGSFDLATEAVVRAFQRHFRPERVDGVADNSTVETLRRLTAALSAVSDARTP